MELRRISICLALIILSAFTYCSDARHSIIRRDADYYDDDSLLGDAASDDEAQNDDGDDNGEGSAPANATIVTEPLIYNITVGWDIRLECTVVPNNNVVIKWSKNGQPYFIGGAKIEVPDDRYVMNATDLIIKDVKLTDSGVYKCEILQSIPVSIEHRVVVSEPPSIIRFEASDNGRVVEGSDLLLTCEVTGSPPPQIMWSRDRNHVNERLREKDGEFTHNTVFIRGVKREHIGKYYCYAINSAGHSERDLTVTVLGKPRVHVHKTEINAAINTEALLRCSAHDEEPVHIHWYKDGIRIENSPQYVISSFGRHSNLTVIPQSEKDFGVFTCEASNDYGKHNKSVDLTQGPVIEDLDVDGPKLSWKVNSHQPLEEIEIQLRDLDGDGNWNTVRVPIPKPKDHKYEIIYPLHDKIAPGKYEAVIKARNNVAWGTHSRPVRVEIEAQPQYIQHASVFRDGAHSLQPASATVLSTILMYLLVRML